MDKKYKKFYEVGYNKYYTLVADGDTYIATESFIPMSTKLPFIKKGLTQGLKLLKLDVPILCLLLALNDAKLEKGQSRVDEDMRKYQSIDTIELKNSIKAQYDYALNYQIAELDNWLKTMEDELREKLTDDNGNIDKKDFNEKLKLFKDRHKGLVEKARANSPLQTVISLRKPQFHFNKTITDMINDGYEHLYTERMTAFADHTYLYNIDCYGTITIYRIITVKGIIKSVDTFIYDKKIVEALLKSEEEN